MSTLFNYFWQVLFNEMFWEYIFHSMKLILQTTWINWNYFFKFSKQNKKSLVWKFEFCNSQKIASLQVSISWWFELFYFFSFFFFFYFSIEDEYVVEVGDRVEFRTIPMPPKRTQKMAVEVHLISVDEKHQHQRWDSKPDINCN